jgi:hypothetical protein
VIAAGAAYSRSGGGSIHLHGRTTQFTDVDAKSDSLHSSLLYQDVLEQDLDWIEGVVHAILARLN